jgi:hypothetical protein
MMSDSFFRLESLDDYEIPFVLDGDSDNDPEDIDDDEQIKRSSVAFGGLDEMMHNNLQRALSTVRHSSMARNVQRKKTMTELIGKHTIVVEAVVQRLCVRNPSHTLARSRTCAPPHRTAWGKLTRKSCFWLLIWQSHGWIVGDLLAFLVGLWAFCLLFWELSCKSLLCDSSFVDLMPMQLLVAWSVPPVHA